MATWSRFVDERPDLAQVGRELLAPGDIAYLATVRPDGGPRVHPVCPLVAGGHLLVAVVPESPKLSDLRRDPRCVLHTLPGEDDAEFSLRARAVEVTDGEVAELFDLASRLAGLTHAAGSVLVELDIERVDTARWPEAPTGSPARVAERDRWSAPG